MGPFSPRHKGNSLFRSHRQHFCTLQECKVPWQEYSETDERFRFITRLLDGERHRQRQHRQLVDNGVGDRSETGTHIPASRGQPARPAQTYIKKSARERRAQEEWHLDPTRAPQTDIPRNRLARSARPASRLAGSVQWVKAVAVKASRSHGVPRGPVPHAGQLNDCHDKNAEGEGSDDAQDQYPPWNHTSSHLKLSH